MAQVFTSVFRSVLGGGKGGGTKKTGTGELRTDGRTATIQPLQSRYAAVSGGNNASTMLSDKLG